jgi:SAM-dependent methyltransferase
MTEKLEAFFGKVMTDLSGGMITLTTALGLRLGLFDALAEAPATASELAARTAVAERYALEFLRCLHAAGYVEEDPEDGRYRLPPEHAQVLAREGGPLDVGGMVLWMLHSAQVAGRVEQAFRDGKGVPPDAYPDAFWAAMERLGASLYENALTDRFLPAVPGLRERLERGARVLDVGCGSGRALIELARKFPASSFLGVDLLETQVARARRNVLAAGVGDRVEVLRADASAGIASSFDVIALFDVLHDARDPAALLASCRHAIRAGGLVLCLEMACHDHAHDNVGPMAAALYTVSIFYCMQSSLAQGGPGLGTLGLPESRLRALASNAGFASVERVAGDAMNAFYTLRPA